MNELPKTRRKWYRRLRPWLGALVALLVLVRLTVLAPREIDLIIGHDTTRISGPLKADGTVDYAAWLNDRYSRGVTRDNNAAIPLFRTFGPSSMWLDDKEIRERTLALLDIDPIDLIDPDAELFDSLGEYIDQRDPFKPAHPVTSPSGRVIGFRRPRRGPVWPASQSAMEKQEHQRLERLYEAMSRPFKAEDEPLIADWIEASARPLAAIQAASRLPKYYFPVILGYEHDTLVKALRPTVNQFRPACRAFCARAMMRTQTGDTDGAWADIMTGYRLARLVSQGSTLVDRLVGMAVEEMAAGATAALACSGKLTNEQAMKCLSDLRALPELPGVIEAIDQEARFVDLDSMMAMKRGHAFVDTGNPFDDRGERIDPALLDWNIVLRMMNKAHDETIEALRVESPVARRKAFESPAESSEDDWRRLDEDLESGRVKFKLVLMRILGKPFQVYAARAVGQLTAGILLPSLARSADLHDAAVMRFELSKIAMALAAFKAAKGAHPLALSELEGAYLRSIPSDIFAPEGGTPVYCRTGDGYLLYSVGLNYKDDGGIESSSSDGSDIVIRAGKEVPPTSASKPASGR